MRDSISGKVVSVAQRYPRAAVDFTTMVTDDQTMPLDLAGFNRATPDELRPLLTACLAVPRWVEAVLAGRPYPGLDTLLASAETAAALSPAEIRRAIAAHPRIGDRATGRSRAEQSGVDSSAAERFRAANAA